MMLFMLYSIKGSSDEAQIIFYHLKITHQIMVLCDVLISVNFGCFSPSRCSHFHCNAMRKAIKAHKNLHTNQQNKHIHPWNGFQTVITECTADGLTSFQKLAATLFLFHCRCSVGCSPSILGFKVQSLPD